MSKKYLFYITLNYSFEILKPLQAEFEKRGAEVMWLALGKNLNHAYFDENDLVESNIDKARKFNPDACFVPGNYVPNFIPGLKVQVFHGLEWKKKGHFSIRGHFDIYCTHGPATTDRFNRLANKHKYFDVIETGWPKLDKLFSSPAYSGCPKNKKTILYAPTFSPNLTSVASLYSQISELSKKTDYHWLVKFHPKMDKTWVQKYKQLESENLQVIETPILNELLQRADILLSDTSSVIGEFALLSKPVVSFKNSQPGDYLIDITDENLLESAIESAFSPSPELLSALCRYTQELHPYSDGRSSLRIADAIEHLLKNGKKAKGKKPLNLLRNLKIRKKLKYWKPTG